MEYKIVMDFSILIFNLITTCKIILFFKHLNTYLTTNPVWIYTCKHPVFVDYGQYLRKDGYWGHHSSDSMPFPSLRVENVIKSVHFYLWHAQSSSMERIYKDVRLTVTTYSMTPCVRTWAMTCIWKTIISFPVSNHYIIKARVRNHDIPITVFCYICRFTIKRFSTVVVLYVFRLISIPVAMQNNSCHWVVFCHTDK